MSSAEMRRCLPAARTVIVVAFAFTLTGCVSTEQKAAWLHVVNARIVASSDPTVVTQRNLQVRATGVTMVSLGARLAIVVTLRNAGERPANDVPIIVGLRAPGRRPVSLNTAGGLDYFRAHVAEIPGQGSITWVFVTRRTTRRGERPFAVVGAQPKLGIPPARTIPRIDVTESAAPDPKGRVRVSVTNLSSIPQADVPVYILASVAGRYTAAGAGALATLAPGHTASTTIAVVGRPAAVRLQLEALPTLF